MMFKQNRFLPNVWRRLRTTIGIRFSPIAGASIAAPVTSMAALSVCDRLATCRRRWPLAVLRRIRQPRLKGRMSDYLLPL